jgi:formamidopyrimidine-DNA glycosylase
MVLLHLGMSGSLSFARQLPPAGVHDHFELVTTAGTLRLNDPRRFGAVVFAQGEASPVAQKLLGRLGMEPLSDDFDVKLFHGGLKRRSASIKQVLLAGEVVVGVGNIYASEALFHAGIRPTLAASKVSAPRAARLHAAVRMVLARAVERGGSTLRDFSSADGQAGHFQLEAMVYARAGMPCKVCGTAVKNIRQGQRSTFFCTKCQKM